MSEQEKMVKDCLDWKLKCKHCEANISAEGLKSLPLAEEFITKHAAEMNHVDFVMEVVSLFIVNETDETIKTNKKPVSLEIKVIKDETAVKPCGKN